MGKICVITSYKGGVGKSTVALNLAAAAVKAGRRVLLSDMDSASRSLDMYLGVEDAFPYNFGDVLAGRQDFESGIFRGRIAGVNGVIHFLPAMYENSRTDGSGRFGEIVEAARRAYDYTIFDCPPGKFAVEGGLYAAADFAFVVAAHSSVAVRSAERCASELRCPPDCSVRLVINGFRPKAVVGGRLPGIVEIIESTRVPLIGVVSYDREIPATQEQGKTVFEYGRKTAMREFNDIFGRMEGGDIPLPRIISGVKTRKLYYK